jgi:hypothetical protein
MDLQRLRDQDIDEVLANLTPEDRAELDAAQIHDPRTAFQIGAVGATVLGAVVHDGKAVAIYGCTPDPHTPGAGIPWMVATPTFRQHRRRAMALSRQVVADMQSHHVLLHNFVHREHMVAIPWLSWLGFEIDMSRGHGANDAFFYFRRSNPDV